MEQIKVERDLLEDALKAASSFLSLETINEEMDMENQVAYKMASIMIQSLANKIKNSEEGEFTI